MQGADREESQLRGSQTPTTRPPVLAGAPGVSAEALAPEAAVHGGGPLGPHCPPGPLPPETPPPVIVSLAWTALPFCSPPPSLDRAPLLLQASLPRVMSPLASAYTPQGVSFYLNHKLCCWVAGGGGGFQQHLLESGGIAGRKPSLATGSA